MQNPHIVRRTVDPTSAPPEAGIHWINTTTGKEFFSVGTASVGDWLDRSSGSIDTSNFKRSTSSGLITGGEVQINIDPTKINVLLGAGTIVDSWTVDGISTPYDVTWTDKMAVAVTYISTHTQSWIGIDRTGTLVQYSSFPTNAQRRDVILLAQLAHSDLTTVNNIIPYYEFMPSIDEQFRDYILALGLVNIGNKISANGANLKLNKSAGELYGLGINYLVSKKDPNLKFYPSASAFTFQYRTKTGAASVNTTDVDATKYDNAGTATNISGSTNQATNQRFYLFPNGNTRAQYGQTVYSSLSLAVAGLAHENFDVFPNIAENAALIGVLSVTVGATALNDAATATFTPVSRLGEVAGGGSSGSSTTDLQQAYNNSLANPEILIDSTRGAVTYRASVADTDDVVNLQNVAGNNVLQLKANGFIEGSIFSLTFNNTSPNNLITATIFNAVSTADHSDIVLIPKGTGALTMQLADNTTAGGNKRGTNAVDLQMSRTAATQVVSGSGSFGAGIRNTVSGVNSMAIGLSNTVSANTAGAIGASNTVSATYGFAAGFSNNVSANAAVAFGQSNAVSAAHAFAIGTTHTVSGPYSGSFGVGGNTHGTRGKITHSGTYFATVGDAQKARIPLCVATTDATPTRLSVDSNVAVANNQYVLQNNTSAHFEATIIGRKAASNDTAVFKIEGLISRGANAASTTIVTSSVTTYSNVPAWGTPTLSADTTLGGLNISVIGLAATNIRWSSNLLIQEITY